MRENDAISRSAVLEVGNVRQVTEYDEAGYSMTYNAVPVNVIEALTSLDVAQIVTNGKDTTYLRVKKLDGLRGRIVIDEESGNRCAMYYEEAEDLAPVVHARWIRDDLGSTRCSNCHTRLPFRHCYDDEDGYEWDDEIDETPWCMHCGARMDGEAE